jgi:hypothetical protein
MHDPARGSDRVIARSQDFKWLLLADPEPGDAEYRDAARRLASAIESAGWERVGAGATWYAMRFVWRAEGPPADDVDVTAAAAEEGT